MELAVGRHTTQNWAGREGNCHKRTPPLCFFVTVGVPPTFASPDGACSSSTLAGVTQGRKNKETKPRTSLAEDECVALSCFGLDKVEALREGGGAPQASETLPSYIYHSHGGQKHEKISTELPQSKPKPSTGAEAKALLDVPSRTQA